MVAEAGEGGDGLHEQVGVSGVPSVLLDQVAHEAAQTRVMAAIIRCVDKLVEPAVAQGCGELRPGPLDGPVPQGVRLLGVLSAAEVNSHSPKVAPSSAFQ
jgi:hypothetical protein